MELQGKESLQIEFHFLLMGDRFGPSILESVRIGEINSGLGPALFRLASCN